MARRKRASMREGPLADLFRSTSDEPSQEPPEFEPRTSDDTGGPQGDPIEPQAAETTPAPEPEVHSEPDPEAAGRFGRQDPLEARAEQQEPVEPAPRAEEPGPLSAPDPAADTSSVPDAQDRLKRIFSEPPADRDEWTRTAMVRVPDAVTAEMVAEVLPTVHRPQARPHGIRFARFREGQSAQVMHLGRADTRDAAVATLHRFIADRGGAPSGARHEIHLSDPRRVPADRVRTLIRQPFSVA